MRTPRASFTLKSALNLYAPTIFAKKTHDPCAQILLVEILNADFLLVDWLRHGLITWHYNASPARV
jgi:hypothetical protein